MSGRQALLIVDMQNDFCHPDGAMARRGARVDLMPQVAAANRRLARACRESGRPVLFTRTEHGVWTDSATWRGRIKTVEHAVDRLPVCVGEWGAGFFDITPDVSDRVVVKHRYSAFYGTDLEIILRARRIDELIVTGVLTNVCVESTVRDAFIRDYDTVVVPEACAASTADEHEASLRTMAAFFGRVSPLEKVLTALAAESAQDGH